MIIVSGIEYLLIPHEKVFNLFRNSKTASHSH